jgi:hypothetical protein
MSLLSPLKNNNYHVNITKLSIPKLQQCQNKSHETQI